MEIPEEIFNIYFDTADDFIDSNFGVNCKVYYPPKRVDCQNCIFDPLTRKSSNRYQSGGPVPFSVGNCPYCNGEGFRNSVDTDDVILRAYFNRKDWIKIPVPIDLPDGSVQTIGHMVDLPKILRCNEISINTQVEGYNPYLYNLAAEPVPHGFKRKKYFIAMWKRK